MITLTNANPDYYCSSIPDNSQNYKERTIIYSTLDDFSVGQIDGTAENVENIPKTKNLTLYALNLTLVSDICIPGGNVQIYCKVLKVEKGDIVLSVAEERESIMSSLHTPEPYHDPSDTPKKGTDGDAIAADLNKKDENRYGKQGKQGGSITIICDDIQLAGTLTLRADGAQGYPACHGQQGQTSSKPDVPGGQGGKGGKGGDGGDGGSVEIRYRTLDNPDKLKMSANPGQPGETGSPGEGGYGPKENDVTVSRRVELNIR